MYTLTCIINGATKAWTFRTFEEGKAMYRKAGTAGVSHRTLARPDGTVILACTPVAY